MDYIAIAILRGTKTYRDMMGFRVLRLEFGSVVFGIILSIGLYIRGISVMENCAIKLMIVVDKNVYFRFRIKFGFVFRLVHSVIISYRGYNV